MKTFLIIETITSQLCDNCKSSNFTFRLHEVSESVLTLHWCKECVLKKYSGKVRDVLYDLGKSVIPLERI